MRTFEDIVKFNSPPYYYCIITFLTEQIINVPWHVCCILFFLQSLTFIYCFLAKPNNEEYGICIQHKYSSRLQKRAKWVKQYKVYSFVWISIVSCIILHFGSTKGIRCNQQASNVLITSWQFFSSKQAVPQKCFDIIC